MRISTHTHTHKLHICSARGIKNHSNNKAKYTAGEVKYEVRALSDSREGIKTAIKMVLACLEMSLLHSEEAVTHDKPFSV